MNNTLKCRLFAGLFLLALVLPFPLWWMMRGGLDTENHENRELAAFPQVGQLALAELPAGFEDWLGDHAPFRNQWMTLNAGLNWRVFGTVNSETVLAGQEGWLFYKNAWDSASLDDYQGINLYTETQMAQIADNLNELQSNLAAKGIDLVVMPVPNKELVYRRYMPMDVPMVNPKGRVDVLVEYLKQHTDVMVEWREAELRAISQEQPVYYKYDTHWNEAGAVFQAAWLCQSLGLTTPAPEALAFEKSDTPPLVDLATLSATWKLVTPDEGWRASNWLEDISLEHTAVDEAGYYDRYTSASPNDQKLLVFRDSFGETLREPLAKAFSASAFVHINAFGEDTIESERPDVFVLQFNQRYCDRLLDYLPRLVAWTSD